MKRCSKCGKEKLLEKFNKQSKSKDGYSCWCRACHNSWRRNNRSRYIEYNRKSESKYRKAWMDFFTLEYGRYPKCQICGKQLSWHGEIFKDLVYFDHRGYNGSSIRRGVYSWLRRHTLNERNIAEFRKENFGILCHGCNITLPTNLKRRAAIIAYLMEPFESC